MSPTRCTQRRLLRRGPRPYVAAAIKNALTLARRPPQVLLYFQSARLFQFHRLTWSFGDGVLLLHRNGSVFAERVHWGNPDDSTQWGCARTSFTTWTRRSLVSQQAFARRSLQGRGVIDTSTRAGTSRPRSAG